MVVAALGAAEEAVVGLCCCEEVELDCCTPEELMGVWLWVADPVWAPVWDEDAAPAVFVAVEAVVVRVEAVTVVEPVALPVWV